MALTAILTASIAGPAAATGSPEPGRLGGQPASPPVSDDAAKAPFPADPAPESGPISASAVEKARQSIPIVGGTELQFPDETRGIAPDASLLSE
ncbi:hypothetical protein ATY41_02640 [Leifsonia xyli subsp. xyli]|uniref:Uncharacterized protein n=1 Tax=Leifsonia xyli subsp. xyli TaxID=59736 RepID=A0A1E2SJC9_LEIXY|nr:hypothetical protein ATY41_02640 [Leifsonia xyli subsp. xyli]